MHFKLCLCYCFVLIASYFNLILNFMERFLNMTVLFRILCACMFCFIVCICIFLCRILKLTRACAIIV